MVMFTPIRVLLLTPAEEQKALSLLILLKEKPNGKVKGCMRTDGRPQQEKLTKYKMTSPTDAIENVFLAALIDTYECRDVATCDILGASLQSDQDPNDEKL